MPNASKSVVIGRHGNAFKIKLHTPAIEGRANEELLRFVAEALGVSRATVRLRRGGKSRQKGIEVDDYPGDLEGALIAAG